MQQMLHEGQHDGSVYVRHTLLYMRNIWPIVLRTEVNRPDILALLIFQVEHKDKHDTCYFPCK